MVKVRPLMKNIPVFHPEQRNVLNEIPGCFVGGFMEIRNGLLFLPVQFCLFFFHVMRIQAVDDAVRQADYRYVHI